MSLLGVSLALAISPTAAIAQSGSSGGSIGNDAKSLSGSRSVEPERPARRSKPEADEPRRRSGGGAFDGTWVVNSVGVTCSGSSTTAVIVSGGRIIGEGLSGTVSANGSSRSVGNYDGIIVTSTGHTDGRTGSGTFRRSDGCVGRWTSARQ